ncbi:MAG: tetratricopeptide repeat protein [Bacteroidetes bacterium]|jgi:class 3 adenylate cyclase/tetratricopeptide (TPR) repeat protein|nr:MAG: tetratricopeptide repeat protein [Bacteroidota bacterium]
MRHFKAVRIRIVRIFSFLLLSGFLLSSLSSYPQFQGDLDSLERVYLEGAFNPQDSLEILNDLAVTYQDPQMILLYSEALISVARRQDSIYRLYQGHLQKGNGYIRLGNQVEALENYFEAAKFADSIGATNRMGTIFITIADVYSLMNNAENAREYYQRAIGLLRKTSDTLQLAAGIANAGDFYYNQGELDSALVYFEESGAIFKAIDYQLGIGYYLGSLGMIYAEQGRQQEALAKLDECLDILEKEGDYYGIAAFLPFVSNIYRDQGDIRSAIRYARRSLDVAAEYGLKEQIRDANLLLSELHEELGNTTEALNYYKGYTLYKDSISNVGLVQEMARMRTDFEIDKKQAEVDILEKEAEIRELSEKRQDAVLFITIVILLLAFVLAFGLYRRYKYIRKTRDIIQREKSRSDELLLNILPEETAEELKNHGRVSAKKFESVSVLFADFVGFTSYSEKMSPEDLVKTVDYYFSRFDQAAEKYGLEKIKTMGDCYMCAGGLPFPTEDHAVKMVRFAQEILEIVLQDGYTEVTGFKIRLGIHTGPVVAGVVGTKKFAYDIWGDTVNIASRMESASQPGKINVSENTYQLIRDDFECEFRGRIDVKNKGMMKMYFIKDTGGDSGDPKLQEQAQTDVAGS